MIDFSGYVAFQAANDLSAGFAVGLTFPDVLLGGLVGAHPGDSDSPEGVVGLTVAASLRRCLMICPEDAWTGLAPHRAAKDASEVRRWGLSPAVTSSAAAASGPTPARRGAQG